MNKVLAKITSSYFNDDPRIGQLCWINCYSSELGNELCKAEFVDQDIGMFGLFNYLQCDDTAIEDIDKILKEAVIYDQKVFHILDPQEIVELRLNGII
jgi:hypothetical protein